MLLDWLVSFTGTAQERQLLALGHPTYNQVMEQSFWFRLAYHGFREFGGRRTRVELSIEETTGAFTVLLSVVEHGPVARLVVPGEGVRALLDAIHEHQPGRPRVPLHPAPVESLVRISRGPRSGEVTVTPVLRVRPEGGEPRLYERGELERFRYGDLVFVPELRALAELERPPRALRRLNLSRPMTLDGARVPRFLERLADATAASPAGSERVAGLRLFDDYDRMIIAPRAIDRDWCWLSLRYGVGNAEISLDEILAAREKGKRFVETAQGWVDCAAPAFDPERVLAGRGPEERAGGLRLSRIELLRLKLSGADVAAGSDGELEAALGRLFELRPARPLRPLAGLASSLRGYQALGVEWLLYLHDNSLGGLLCDYMGLGKTHQLIGLMLALREQRGVEQPFLVVCPATVLSHWERIIRVHAPGLRAAVFHGGGAGPARGA